jgi:hypothetical protein
MLAFADSMAIKAAIELRLADIIQSHDDPITLSQIASVIDSSTPPNTDYLFRIMRYLVNKKIFSVDKISGETLYSPTPLSIWISNDFELSLAPMILFQNHPLQCNKPGGIAFQSVLRKEVTRSRRLMVVTHGNLVPRMVSTTICLTMVWLVLLIYLWLF